MAAHQRILASRGRPASWGAAAKASADYGAGDSPDWRTIRWAEYLRAVTVEARRVHLVDIGSGAGPPILLVHGLGGRWQNWIENIPRIAGSHRVVAVDLPGFGRSQLPVAPITIAGYARTLDRVCDLLELEAPLVVGNSLGGVVIAELALRFPERVGSLAFVAAACLAPADLDSRAAQLALVAGGRLASSLLRGPSGAVTRPRARHVVWATVLRHPTRIANDTLYELAGGVRPPGAAAALAALGAHDVSDELGAIEAPTLVVHGRDDVLIPCADAQLLASMIPGAELIVFDDTGHMPMVERPVPFDDALLGFAERVASGSRSLQG
jgi:pimeloyl-ACP methyl ester carboxylesterase